MKLNCLILNTRKKKSSSLYETLIFFFYPEPLNHRPNQVTSPVIVSFHPFVWFWTIESASSDVKIYLLHYSPSSFENTPLPAGLSFATATVLFIHSSEMSLLWSEVMNPNPIWNWFCSVGGQIAFIVRPAPSSWSPGLKESKLFVCVF